MFGARGTLGHAIRQSCSDSWPPQRHSCTGLTLSDSEFPLMGTQTTRGLSFIRHAQNLRILSGIHFKSVELRRGTSGHWTLFTENCIPRTQLVDFPNVQVTTRPSLFIIICCFSVSECDLDAYESFLLVSWSCSYRLDSANSYAGSLAGYNIWMARAVMRKTTWLSQLLVNLECLLLWSSPHLFILFL